MATEVMAAPVPSEETTSFSLEDDTKLLKELNAKPYKAQAVWFLNAFWKKGPAFGDNLDEAEKVWTYHNSCVELDPESEEGNELDEMKAHILLERTEGALTVRELRERLKSIDLDFNKYVSLTEYLVTSYNVDWRELVHAPQGEVDEAKLSLAQEKVEEAKQAIADCEARAKEAKAAEREAVASEAQAKKNEESAKASEAEAVEADAVAQRAAQSAKDQESKAFQEEEASKEAETNAVKLAEEQVAVQKQVEEALETVKREEKAFNDELAALEAAANDESSGIVARNKAKNELAQLQQTDPIPLQRAKISQEAVVRRQERATKSAASARAAAESARVQAEESRKEAVVSRERAEDAACQATSRRRSAEEDAAKASSAREKAEEDRAAAEKFREEANIALQTSTEAFQAAQAYLEKVKRECAGAGKGKLWWLDRELEEAKKYMSPAQLARLQAAPALKEDQVVSA